MNEVEVERIRELLSAHPVNINHRTIYLAAKRLLLEVDELRSQLVTEREACATHAYAWGKQEYGVSVAEAFAEAIRQRDAS